MDEPRNKPDQRQDNVDNQLNTNPLREVDRERRKDDQDRMMLLCHNNQKLNEGSETVNERFHSQGKPITAFSCDLHLSH